MIKKKSNKNYNEVLEETMLLLYQKQEYQNMIITKEFEKAEQEEELKKRIVKLDVLVGEKIDEIENFQTLKIKSGK